MPRRLEVEIVADAAAYSKGLKEAETRTQKFVKAAGVAGAAIGGALVVGLKKSVDAAEAAQVSTSRMDVAFKTAHQSAGAFTDQIEKTEGAARKLGFQNSDVRDSLGSLVVATHDGRKAIQDLGVAEDIARFKHIGLQQASKVLTMAMAGSQRAVKQLGLQITPTTANMDALRARYKELGKEIPPAEAAQAKFLDKQQTSQQVIGLVSEKLHGQAKAYADTAAGGMAQFHAQLDDLEEKMGKGLLPAISKVAGVLAELVGFFAKHTTTTKILVAALGALSGILLTVSVSMKVAAAATFILENAMTFGLAAAIAALVVGIVELIKHWGTVKMVMQTVAGYITGAFTAAWNAVLGTIKGVFNWLKANWPLLVGILTGPIGVATVEIVRHWAAIRRGAQDALNAVVGFFGNVGGRIRDAFVAGWNAIVSTFRVQFGRAYDAASSIIGDIVGLFRGLPTRIGKAVLAAAGDGWDLVKQALEKTFGGAWRFVKGIFGIHSPSSVFADLGKQVVLGFVKGMEDNADVLKKAAGSVFGAVGHADPPQGLAPGGRSAVLGWLTTALQYTHHYSGANLAALYGRTMQESGGNPAAINLWDSNAKAGHPSKGLLQTIDSTFDTYSVAGHKNIWNPVDNAIAAIRYMYAAYGHIVGPSGTGYDQGGILPPGVTLAVNTTGKPEMVIPAGGGLGGPIVNVYVQGSVTSERDLARTIRDIIVRAGQRNGGGMLAGLA